MRDILSHRSETRGEWSAERPGENSGYLWLISYRGQGSLMRMLNIICVCKCYQISPAVTDGYSFLQESQHQMCMKSASEKQEPSTLRKRSGKTIEAKLHWFSFLCWRFSLDEMENIKLWGRKFCIFTPMRWLTIALMCKVEIDTWLNVCSHCSVMQLSVLGALLINSVGLTVTAFLTKTSIYFLFRFGVKGNYFFFFFINWERMQ